MSDLQWWQKAIFYQIYPRSFADSNGDGSGDLRGITGKLDYLKWLGIEAIWLSPHYPSPQIDGGYDISDYTAVNPEYGTMEDFKEFLHKAHRRGMRVILDFVLNHTSWEHPWFQESRATRDNPQRDWYIWRDGKHNGAPNNWQSMFGGSAWTRDEATGQYYYHNFLKEQPDLNWRNPEVKAAMFEAMDFWLQLGVDGFRLDAIGTIYEDPDLRPHTAPITPARLIRRIWHQDSQGAPRKWDKTMERLFQYQLDLPEIHDLLQEIRRWVDRYPHRMLIGETENPAFLGNGGNELHSVFNFKLLENRSLTPKAVRQAQSYWHKRLPPGGWRGNTLNNHDKSRRMSYFKERDPRLAGLDAALMLTLDGNPYLYYGEEIGMRDYALASFDEVRDMVAMVFYHLMKEEGEADEVILKGIRALSRDRCRTPMQWDSLPNAGFSPPRVRTWLPVHPDFQEGVNVAAQQEDENSLLNFYRSLIRLRKENPALHQGGYREVKNGNRQVLSFLRKDRSQTCLVMLNFSPRQSACRPRLKGKAGKARLLFPTRKQGEKLDLGKVALEPYGVLVAEL